MNVHVYTTMFSTLWLQKNVAYALDIILLLLFNSASTCVCVCVCVCVVLSYRWRYCLRNRIHDCLVPHRPVINREIRF